MKPRSFLVPVGVAITSVAMTTTPAVAAPASVAKGRDNAPLAGALLALPLEETLAFPASHYSHSSHASHSSHFSSSYTVPDYSAPDDSLPDYSTPDYTVPDYTTPDSTVPEYTESTPTTPTYTEPTPSPTPSPTPTPSYTPTPTPTDTPTPTPAPTTYAPATESVQPASDSSNSGGNPVPGILVLLIGGGAVWWVVRKVRRGRRS